MPHIRKGARLLAPLLFKLVLQHPMGYVFFDHPTKCDSF